jgi:hypothetical protein
MPSKKITFSARDKYRVLSIVLCLALMVYGVFRPASISFGQCVPVDLNGAALVNVIGKRFYVDNVFLMLGGFGLTVLLGLVQIIKAWRGDKSAP